MFLERSLIGGAETACSTSNLLYMRNRDGLDAMFSSLVDGLEDDSFDSSDYISIRIDVEVRVKLTGSGPCQWRR
jgi:hypothetical protein